MHGLNIYQSRNEGIVCVESKIEFKIIHIHTVLCCFCLKIITTTLMHSYIHTYIHTYTHTYIIHNTENKRTCRHAKLNPKMYASKIGILL